jgi:hypothetical protein
MEILELLRRLMAAIVACENERDVLKAEVADLRAQLATQEGVTTQ